MRVNFIWKLIDSDVFEQEFNGYYTVFEAMTAWCEVWGVDFSDCEEFTFLVEDSISAPKSIRYTEPSVPYTIN